MSSKSTLWFCVFVVCVACGGTEEAASDPSPSDVPTGTESAAVTAGPPRAAAAVDFDALRGCSLLGASDVAAALRVDAVESEEIRARGHLRGCRYTWNEGGVVASLELQLERRREGHPGFERGLESRRRGLPVVGREGIVQAFTPVAGLGVEALYSGNVQDLKALFVRATPTLQLSLQHARVGADSGNLSPALEVLARRVLAQLGPA